MAALCCAASFSWADAAICATISFVLREDKQHKMQDVSKTMNPIPPDYDERVYAGVLGKLIGVYLGRPFEQWSHDAIEAAFGEVTHYVNARVPYQPKPALIVADDDISGTFTFVRALEDHGCTADLTAEQIGQTWLNYLIENKTILWWGGMGMSTEHTAYQRLKHGIPAPRSGSIALNGPIVAEQIGAQIFIDGWAMVAPNNPLLAVELARKAGSVSHDGEAIYAAQVVAAMESLAFVESDLNRLIDRAVSFIPADSLIARMIADVRAWRSKDNDWRETLQRIQEIYGYERYGGNCHVVPNHALIILALVYCDDDFQRALMIVCTAGYDTDCNAANVGCIMGIKNGLRGIDSSPVDWRGPVADKILLPTADGGRCITDAVQVAQRIIALGRTLAGEATPAPRARFNFGFAGSMQGFSVVEGDATLSNTAGALSINSKGNTRISTPTFLSQQDLAGSAYSLAASPTLYPGQTVIAEVSSDADIRANLFITAYGADDKLETHDGEVMTVRAGEKTALQMTPAMDGGSPIAQVGIRVQGNGALHLHSVDWQGTPAVMLTHPSHNGTAWKRAWVQACDNAAFGWDSPIRMMSNAQMGMMMHGEQTWSCYTAQATITPNLARSFGIAVCVQGLRRAYQLTLANDGKARLIKVRDDERRVLAEADCDWSLYQPYTFSLTTDGKRIAGAINGRALFDVIDEDQPLLHGAVALLIEEGRIDCDGLRITPC